MPTASDARVEFRSALLRTILVAAAVAAVVALITVLLVRAPATAAAPSRQANDLYSVVRQRGTLRVGYYVGAPYFTLDPNTRQRGGIFHDVVEALGEKLNLEVVWAEEVGFGEMIEGLRSRRFDIVGSGVWMNAARGNEADFSIPILYDVVFAYGRADDPRFSNDLTAINNPGVSISTIDGEMAALIAATDFPQAKTLALPQATDFTVMVQNVVDRRADVTFLGLGTARKYEAANPGKIRNLDPSRPVRVFPAAIVLPPNQYSLKRAIDIALGEMINNGEVEAIIRRNEEMPNSHYRIAPEYLNPAGQQ